MKKTIEQYETIEVVGGQIMSRIVAKEEDTEFIRKVKVVVPKAITAEGFIMVEELIEEKIKSEPPVERITREGDIVIKLSTPFDTAFITKETEGCVVPSFCAIIRNKGTLNIDYLRAFLASKECKDQLKSKVIGAVMSILSISRIKSVEIPDLDIEQQRKIGEHYREVQEKLQTMRQIIVLENKRNDILFQEISK